MSSYVVDASVDAYYSSDKAKRVIQEYLSKLAKEKSYENNGEGISLSKAYLTLLKEASKPYYRDQINVDGKWIPVLEVPANYLPSGVLGMTDLQVIWIRNDLDQMKYGLRKKVLKHEAAHVKHPQKSEMTIREETDTVDPLGLYSMN